MNYQVGSHFYRPPTELQEGNVSSRVCVSLYSRRKGCHVTITHSALTLPYRYPQRCSNLFSSDLTVQPPRPCSSPIQGPTPTPVGKLVVSILMECFLVRYGNNGNLRQKIVDSRYHQVFVFL